MPYVADTLPAHVVLNTRLADADLEKLHVVDLAMGCFWGAERLMWTQPGVWCTAVGYEGGHQDHPSYREVCSGLTGHIETVRVVFDPTITPLSDLLRVFVENHDPTQGMRQGNDVGEQYRSAIFVTTEEDAATARAVLDDYAGALAKRGLGPITTVVFGPDPQRVFWPAEDDHQQYLAKNPNGYCGLKGTGVACPIPPAPADSPTAQG